MPGGFTATLLDDALGVTAYRATHATPSFTGTLTVNYKSTIPLPSVLLIRTRVKSRNGRKMDVEGEVYVEGKGKPAVTASGLWILMREDHREEKYGKRTAKDERLVRKEGVAAKL